MARLLDKTFSSWDEEYGFESVMGNKITQLLEKLKLNTYNEEYVLRVTVDKVDNRLEGEDGDSAGD